MGSGYYGENARLNNMLERERRAKLTSRQRFIEDVRGWIVLGVIFAVSWAVFLLPIAALFVDYWLPPLKRLTGWQ